MSSSSIEIPAPIANILARVRRALRAFENERSVTSDSFSARWQISVQSEQDCDGSWTAWVDELPGCISCGDTEEEALEGLAEALSGVLAVRLEDAKPTPAAPTAPGRSHVVRQVALG